MIIDDKIRDKKRQYNTKREVTKKFDKYEYLSGKDILRSDQIRIIEEAKFTCSRLGKAFEKEI